MVRRAAFPGASPPTHIPAPLAAELFFIPAINLTELLLYSVPCSWHERYRSKHIRNFSSLCASGVLVAETGTQGKT